MKPETTRKPQHTRAATRSDSEPGGRREAGQAAGDAVPASRKLTQFAYMARYAGRNVERDLATITAQSRRNNVRFGVTGVLIYDAGVFIQVLEGPNDAVTHLMTRILSDERADNVAVLFHRLVDHRELGQWSMLPLRLDRSGIGPFHLESFRSAYRALSAGGDLDAFIDSMRDVVRAEADERSMPGEARTEVREGAGPAATGTEAKTASSGR